MSAETFKDLEHQGWLDKAGAYRDMFGRITEQAIVPILDTFDDLSGKRLLDVASGTGWLAAAAAERGAAAEGLDFAGTMIEIATRSYPSISFREGDAEQLPYPDATFDAVACSFGLLHLANPDRAVLEARRVLKPSGRYTFTVWCGPDDGGDYFRLIMAAIKECGTFDVPLPPAPPIFRFADPEECSRVLRASGFATPATRHLQFKWRTQDPHGVLELIYKSFVRTPMILAKQTEEARARIHRAILTGAEAYRTGEVIEFAFPALLVSALAA